MGKPYIEIRISTCDQAGNELIAIEKRHLDMPPPPPPSADGGLQTLPPIVTLDKYFQIFTSLLIKQEFSRDEVLSGFKDFMVDTDKKDLS